MAEQLTFSLKFRPSLDRGNFLVSPCNEAAVTLIDHWPQWPGAALCLFGPEGSGKSHLAHVFLTRASAKNLNLETLEDSEALGVFATSGSAIVIEDVDRLLATNRKCEETLFHVMNAATQRGGWLLLTARAAPPRWPVYLADLRSRLSALPSVELEEPDDGLLGAVLLKQYTDRGLNVAPGALAYLIPRIERRFKAVADIVERTDELALQEGRAVTVALIKRVLGEPTDISDD